MLNKSGKIDQVIFSLKSYACGGCCRLMIALPLNKRRGTHVPSSMPQSLSVLPKNGKQKAAPWAPHKG